MSDLQLYCDARHCSPWVGIVWTALKEKEIPFQPVPLRLERGEHRTDDYRRHTLTGKVPALRHGDVWIAESLAILEYLEEVFAPPKHPRLLPASPSARARERQLLSWIRSDLFELRRCLPFEGLFVPMGQEVEQPPLTDRARAELEALAHVAGLRADSTEEPTLADFELAFLWRRPLHYGIEVSGAAKITPWAERIWQRPSVQSWVRQDWSSATPTV